MNDVALHKEKINMFNGESTRKVVDIPYTYEEIKKIWVFQTQEPKYHLIKGFFWNEIM